MRSGRSAVFVAALAVALLGVPALAHGSKPFERPGETVPPGRNSYTVPEAPESPSCGAHFCVHWVIRASTRRA